MSWKRRLVEHAFCDALDEDGRPLGEVSSARYGEGRVREVVCPYSGVRRGRVMNASALAQVVSVWPAVLARLSQAGGEEATLGELWRGLVGVVAEAARAPEPVPRAVSATYKVSIGYLQLFTSLLLSHDGLASTPARQLGAAERVYPVLEPSLVGAVQVCAGSPKQIAAGLEALRSGERVPPTAEHDEAALLVAGALLLGVVTRRALLVGERDEVVPSLGPRWLKHHPGPWFRVVLSGACPKVSRVIDLVSERQRGELERLAALLEDGGHRQRHERFDEWLSLREG